MQRDFSLMKFCRKETINIIINVLLYLCSDSVRPGGEKLGDAGSVEASLGQAKGCPKSCSSSSYHHSIKFMIDYWVLSRNLKTMNKVNVQIMSSSHIMEIIMVRECYEYA